MAAAKPYRILTVDAHAIVREGPKQILAEVDDIEVGGEADCSRRALQMARREPWDLVLDGHFQCARPFGFWISGVKNIVAKQNTVKGTGGGGFILDDLWYGTAPVENAMIVMNDLSLFSLSSKAWLAPIFLGAVTHNCTVIGQSLNDDVVDLGTDNKLINVHRIPQSGSSIGGASRITLGLEQLLQGQLGK